jgi:hypothetical protein
MKTIFNVPSLLLAAVSLGLIATACSSSDSSSAAQPNGDAGGSTMADAGSNPTSSKDIVDTALANGNFKTLVGAVQAAGLESRRRRRSS